VLVCLALLTSCGKKDDQLNSFVNDYNSFTDELVKKDTVDEAQAYLDSRKADMKSKFADVKNVGDNQVSPETKKKFEDAVNNSATKLSQWGIKHSSDPGFSAKFQKLMGDFQDIFKM